MENKYYGFIYETTNLTNGMKYVGKCIFSRQNSWRTYLGSGLHFKRALQKYGAESFKREILFLALDEEELNELEEIVIEISNAVESSNYYNLKKTAIGGDIFTYNPRKEEIRKMRQEQMSGEGNHWFGKEKPEHVIQSIKDANSKKIIVDGVLYDSIQEYANKFNLRHNTVSSRLSSPYQHNYLFADENGNSIPKEIKDLNITKSIIAEGKEFASIKQASQELGISRVTIHSRLKSGKYKYKE